MPHFKKQHIILYLLHARAQSFVFWGWPTNGKYSSLLHHRNITLLWTFWWPILFKFAEAITDAPTETRKAVMLQSKCKDQMKTPRYSKSHTKESIHVLMVAIQFYHHHHQNSKNKNETSKIILLTNSSLKETKWAFRLIWESIPSSWKTERTWHLHSLSLQLHLDVWCLMMPFYLQCLMITTLSLTTSIIHCYLQPQANQTTIWCHQARWETLQETSNFQNVVILRSSQPTIRQPILQFQTWIFHWSQWKLSPISHLTPQEFSHNSTWVWE